MADTEKTIEQEMDEELNRVPATTGWLGKKAVRTATKMKWKDRYFQLSPKARKLEYMKQAGGKPILTFKIDKNTKVRLANKYKPNEMEVVFDAHTLYAHSIDENNPEEDIRTWVNRIQQIIDSQDPLKLGEKRLERKKEKERQEEEERLSKMGKLPVENQEGSEQASASRDLSAIDPSEPDPSERVMPGRRRMVQQRAPPAPPRPSTQPPKGQPGVEAMEGESTDLVSRIISVVKSAQQHIGKCYTWGSNWHGKLGIGDATATEKSLPTVVHALIQSHLPEWVAAGGDHCLTITEQGLVFAWGDNKYKQLGTGDSSKQAVYKSLRPVLVTGLRKKPVAQVACGNAHCMALTYGGDLFAWGDGSSGALGIGELDEKRYSVGTPTKVKKIGRGTELGVELIRAGSLSSGAITSDGDCYVWGSNVTGQLGTGLDTVGLSMWEPTRSLIELEDYVTPNDPNDNLGILDVAFGERFSVWLVNDGVLLICGALSMTNSDFFHKQSDTEWIIQNCDTPHLTEDLQMDVLFRKISAGSDMVVAISKEGNVYSAGRGYLGNSDSNESISYPVQNQKCQFTLGSDGRRVPADHNGHPIDTSYGISKNFVPVIGLPPEEKFAEIAVGNIFAMLRTVDGRLYGWGSSSKGQLGTSQMVDIPRPREIRTTELDNMHYTQIAAGTNCCVSIAKPGTSDTLRYRWLARKYAKVWFQRCLKKDPGLEFGRRADYDDNSADRAEELDYVLDDLTKQSDVQQLFNDPTVQDALAQAAEEI
eukprot:gb/GECG01013705.1/.p1 GENE.gb/GECG01013705.1/~~gb/GECG01013705.1/.p1  ORF type:complete len:762 (+),score=97.34 gb/GECG01013705.1/:1-2286(+)